MGSRAAGKIASDYLIMARRREEDQRRLYETTRKSNWDMKFNAEWEIRTAAGIEGKRIEKVFQTIRTQDQTALETRRRKLAGMLMDEQARFQRELESLEKTAEERKNDMMARARSLKQRREEERQQFVRDQYDRQWRMGCDALREADSIAILKACDAARGYQIAEKMDGLEMEEQENRIFDELWEQDRLRKLQREVEEDAMRKQMDSEQTRVLDSQVSELNAFREQEKSLAEEEAHLLQEQWSIEREEAERKEHLRLATQDMAKNELDSYNTVRRNEAVEAMQMERHADKAMLDAMLRKEDQDAAREEQHRQFVKEELLAYQTHLKHVKAQEQENEAELEKLREVELSKAWDKRLQQWGKEQAAREQLMNNVVKERKKQISAKLQRQEREKHEAIDERLKLDRELTRITELEKVQNVAERQIRLDNSQMVQGQIATKSIRKSEKKAEKLYDKELGIKSEAEYNTLLHREIDKTEKSLQAFSTAMAQAGDANPGGYEGTIFGCA